MRYLLTILLFVFGLNGYGQQAKTIKADIDFIAFDSTGSMIRFNSDGSVQVSGDTLQLMKAMEKQIETFSKKYRIALEILKYISVDGIVTDKKNFHKAVKEFKNFK